MTLPFGMQPGAPTNWAGVVLDVAILLVTLAAAWHGIISPTVFVAVLMAVVGARATKGGGPPRPGGGALAGSAAAALVIGIGATLWSLFAAGEDVHA